MDNKLKLLEKKIGIIFNNKEFLIKCLTHKSFNSLNNNEKLEFLGDRVLGLIISKTLLEIFPNDKEGNLDKKLASLVNKKRCSEIGKILNLDKFILTSNKDSKKKIIEDKIVSDALEALIGSIYLDQGIKAAEKFILHNWKDYLHSNIKDQVDSKTRLQEYSLKRYKTLPQYKLISNTGPRHKPRFKISVSLEDLKVITGVGDSKKDAEQKAATLYLKKLGM